MKFEGQIGPLNGDTQVTCHRKIIFSPISEGCPSLRREQDNKFPAKTVVLVQFQLSEKGAKCNNFSKTK